MAVWNPGDNPLLVIEGPPRFDEVEAQHVEPAFQQMLEWAEEEIQAIENRPETAQTYWNTAYRLSQIRARLVQVFNTVQQMVRAARTDPLQQAFQQARGDYDTFMSGLPLRAGLWGALQTARQGLPEDLDDQHRWHLKRLLEEFRHHGANLPGQQRRRVQKIQRRIGNLETQFENNLMQATAAGGVQVLQEERLQGLAEPVRKQARQQAQKRNKQGWWLGLDMPTVQTVLKHARDRKLREEIRNRYFRRAWQDSDHDNKPIIKELLKLRRELAELMGYDNFADWQTALRMTGSGKKAQQFQEKLHEQMQPIRQQEIEEMKTFAEKLGIPELRAWDIGFVRERMREEKLGLEEEQLRPYFPLHRVEDTLFEIARNVFGVEIQEATGDDRPPVWHNEVRFLEVFDPEGRKVGGFYVDWHPRPEKRQGGWMETLKVGGPRPNGTRQPHLGLICGNFRRPDQDQDSPALLSPQEARTIFHEFGHQLHLLLSNVEVPTRNGPEQVPWDFVEVPSQLMENWLWEREVLETMTAHHETGQPLPDEKITQLQKQRTFMPAWTYHRQIGGGLLDLELHTRCAGQDQENPWTVARENMERFTLDERDIEIGRLAGFFHIFQSGYEAAYYSYLWSETLEADLFSRFQQEGIFNQQVGQELIDTLLSRGDTAHPDQMIENFLGREPTQQAWLDRYTQTHRAPPTPARKGR